MMSLSSILPEPINKAVSSVINHTPENHDFTLATTVVPPYGQRKGFIPRKQSDFGDGGAFPEIHIAQFPLGMGLERKMSNALSVQLDESGKIKYDAIARQGHSKDRIVHSRYEDTIAKGVIEDDPELVRPDEDCIKEATEKTRLALEKLTNDKISAAMPVMAAPKQEAAKYIRYTPSQQGPSYNSGAKQRIIRMVEMPQDPMEPPKFKTNKKIPRGPPSPPAPVLHSPSRKVTAKEHSAWKIPPCISNWKNAKGYTIPLDKRLAADGRGLQSVHINENFAKLAEALLIADRKAREAVETRAQLERKLASKEKERKEENLRQLAQRAREERAGIRPAVASALPKEALERDKMRDDRHKDRQRERNLARAAPDKRSKLMRDRERDISEQVALGMPAVNRGADAMYDQRLFNQSKGLASGFDGGEDESYNVYSEPWRKAQDVANAVYRPSRNADSDMYGGDLDKLIQSKRFVPDKQFSGVDRTAARGTGPVQFTYDEEEDPFGLDKFLTEAKKGTKRVGDQAEVDRGKRKK